MEQKILLGPHDQQSNSSFLGQKRRFNVNLKDNLILKKMNPPEQNALEYDRISYLYRNIFSFNWEDEKIIKSKSSPSK